MLKKIFGVVIIMAMLAVSVSAAIPYDFGEGVVYYGFDNQAVYDGGENEYHGSFVGENISFVDGLNGGCAVNMDSDSYVSIPVQATYPSESENMSAIVWFKTDHLNGAWNRIISTGVWGTQSAPGILIGLFHDAGTATDYVAVGIGADDASKNHWNLIGAPEGESVYKFDDDKWHCIGYSVGEGKGALYLDGKQIYTFEYDVSNCSVISYEETACIGGLLYFDNMNEPFAGTVDEVYFIPKTLTADDFAAYYKAESEGSIKHTVSDPPAVVDTEATEDTTTVAPSSEVDTTNFDTTTASDISTDIGTTTAIDASSADTTTVVSGEKDGENNIVIIIAVVAAVAVIAAVVLIFLKKKKK